MPFFNARKNVFTRETVAVSAAVKQLTRATYDDDAGVTATVQPNQFGTDRKKASGAVVVCETSAVRVTKDGTDPVATTTGVKLNPGDVYILETYQDIVKFKATRETVDATLQVEYYR